MIITGWDPAKIERYGPRYLHGLWTTLSLVGLSVILGAVIALPLAFARMSKNRQKVIFTVLAALIIPMIGWWILYSLDLVGPR